MSENDNKAQGEEGGASLLAKHTFIYGLGSAVAAAGSFLLIPLYTHVLAPKDYGALELLNRILSVLLLVMFLGTREAYVRFFFEKPDRDWQRTVTGTMLAFIVGMSLVVVGLCYPLRGILLERFFKGTITDDLVILVLLWAPMELLAGVGLTFLQIRMRSGLFVGIGMTRLAVFITLNLVLVYHLREGVWGVLLCNLLVSSAVALGMSAYLLRWSGFRHSWPLMKELVRFGMPYLPASVMMYVLSSADNYILSANSMMTELGIYALAYKLGMMGTMFVVDPFIKVWAPFLFGNHDRPDGPHILSKVYLVFTFGIVTAGLLISIASPIAIALISSSSFHSAYVYVPLLALAAVFYGMQHIADAGILIAKKTGYKPYIFAMGAAVAVTGDLLLIPRYGALGAALTVPVTYFTLLFLTERVSRKFYVIPLQLRKVGLIFMAAALSYAVCLMLVRWAGTDEWRRAVSLLAFLVYPLVLLAGRAHRWEEYEVLRDTAAGLLRRLRRA